MCAVRRTLWPPYRRAGGVVRFLLLVGPAVVVVGFVLCAVEAVLKAKGVDTSALCEQPSHVRVIRPSLDGPARSERKWSA